VPGSGQECGCGAILEHPSRPPGDTIETCADIARIRRGGGQPSSPIGGDVPRFVDGRAQDRLEPTHAVPS
jgi:hypothetical protein